MSITTWTRLEPDLQTGHAAIDIGAGIGTQLLSNSLLSKWGLLG